MYSRRAWWQQRGAVELPGTDTPERDYKKIWWVRCTAVNLISSPWSPNKEGAPWARIKHQTVSLALCTFLGIISAWTHAAITGLYDFICWLILPAEVPHDRGSSAHPIVLQICEVQGFSGSRFYLFFFLAHKANNVVTIIALPCTVAWPRFLFNHS
jgi:hypothetical protein